ncbi:MAG: rhodanese-like domain-containing protein [Planctomycetes bacterium]|nr:rhodanese-like domain-containing protein [Planctomycetota bacterium]
MKYVVLALVFAGGFLAAHLSGVTTAAVPPQQPQGPGAPAASGPINPDRLAPANPNIDFQGYMKIAVAAQEHRLKRRLTEADFIELSKKDGVIILDARSKEKFDLMHIKGSVNLSFADIDIESLKRVLPDKNATILIYCNNNFTAGGAPASTTITPLNNPLANKGRAATAAAAFPSKNPVLSLNISTYTALYGYGYRNVYELGPLVDPTKTKIELVSTAK